MRLTSIQELQYMGSPADTRYGKSQKENVVSSKSRWIDMHIVRNGCTSKPNLTITKTTENNCIEMHLCSFIINIQDNYKEMIILFQRHKTEATKPTGNQLNEKILPIC